MIAVDGGATASYVYDALGKRIEQLTSNPGMPPQTHYWYDVNGHVVMTWDQNGDTGWDYLYLGNEFIGEYSSFFVFKDHLGSSRLTLNMDQSISCSMDYMPFGEQVGDDSCTDRKFAGNESDVNTWGLSNAQNRYYYSYPARFISPDPHNAGASPADPQTWNMYSYARNNPLRFIDPFGLDTQCTSTTTTSYEQVQDPNTGETIDAPVPMTTVTCSDTPDSVPLDWDFNTGFTYQLPGQSQAPQAPGPTPNNGEPPSACELANIAAVNSVSNLNVSPANVVGEPFVFNGGLNVNFSVPGASPSSLAPGRYPSSFLDSIFGIGSSLHVPGPGGADPSTYGVDPATGNFTFTTHIDTAYATWHTPIGALIHYFVDVRDKGAHRTQCGGAR